MSYVNWSSGSGSRYYERRLVKLWRPGSVQASLSRDDRGKRPGNVQASLFGTVEGKETGQLRGVSVRNGRGEMGSRRSYDRRIHGDFTSTGTGQHPGRSGSGRSVSPLELPVLRRVGAYVLILGNSSDASRDRRASSRFGDSRLQSPARSASRSLPVAPLRARLLALGRYVTIILSYTHNTNPNLIRNRLLESSDHCVSSNIGEGLESRARAVATTYVLVKYQFGSKLTLAPASKVP